MIRVSMRGRQHQPEASPGIEFAKKAFSQKLLTILVLKSTVVNQHEIAKSAFSIRYIL